MIILKQKKQGLVLLLALVFMPIAQAQIKVSELIQESAIAPSENKLYFVDFWATWCAPCVHVSKYLGVLQKEYPDDFYVVSLSQENGDKVKKFIQKHQTDLAVAIDFEGETFKRFTISSLPYGVLFNAEGDVLWEGHPANFNASQLRRFLNRESKTMKVADFLNLQQPDQFISEQEYVPTSNFELVETIDSVDFIDKFEVKHLDHNFKKITGTLHSIVAYFLKCHQSQVSFSLDIGDDRRYQLYSALDDEASLKKLFNSLKLRMDSKVVSGDLLYADVSQVRLWSTNQIDWGMDSPNYLIDDYQIQADNVTLKDFFYKLSEVINLPVISSHSLKDETLHDFQIQYKFYELMQNDFWDTYGIKVEKKKGDYTRYSIKKTQ